MLRVVTSPTSASRAAAAVANRPLLAQAGGTRDLNQPVSPPTVLPTEPEAVDATPTPPPPEEQLPANAKGPDDVTDLKNISTDAGEGHTRAARNAPGASDTITGGTSSGAGGPRPRTLLVRVDDYAPVIYIPAPLVHAPEEGSIAPREPGEADLARLQQLLNARVEAVVARPIMYYRPASPGGDVHLRITLHPGANFKRAAEIVHKTASTGALRAQGFAFSRGNQTLENDAKLMHRFLCDTGLSGGAWLHIAPARGGRSGYQTVSPGARVSTCDLEVVAPWTALDCLTPDATQLADEAWQPEVLRRLGAAAPPALAAAARAAKAGAIPALRVMGLDVLVAPSDGAIRSVDASKDPVICVCCETREQQEKEEEDQDLRMQEEEEEEEVVGGGAGAAAAAPASFEAEGAELRLFGSEGALLAAWRQHVLDSDPDAFTLFQVRDSMGALVARFQQLRVDGGGLNICRLGRESRKPLAIKSVVHTSNQETFKADPQGRLVFDVLRQVLTGQGLATFTLADCVQSLLGETIEVLAPHTLAALAQQMAAGPAGGGGRAAAAATLESQRAAAVRLARYTRRRVLAVRRLTERLATLPESFEMARATGLTVQQVLYNAQMIRTWSLLHRNAHRKGYIIGGKTAAQALSESPFLMHPIEANTAAHYRQPVAILDFASLYPSLYRAYNLCYTTLVHPEDLAAVGRENCTVTPTGAAFVKPALRSGILPDILAALMTARASTRAQLKGEKDPSQRAVLEGRQKALKLTANALYGFTGAQASPLQCVPLADSCLALGAAACRGAVARIAALIQEGTLGPKAAGGRVIYAQTDSVFIHFPSASPAEAIGLGHAAAAAVTAGLTAPMELKFEQVAAPFLLLHVNRYAGRAFETSSQAEEGRGSLMIKGIKAGVLDRVLMHDDVSGAVEVVERQVRRLLTGDVTLWELTMTGGLWRLTGQQVAAAAAAATLEEDEDEIGHNGGGGGGAGAGAAPGGARGGGRGAGGGGAAQEAAVAAAAGGGEDVKGPHASLAVRLTQRDPDRSFVLGERLPYVLLAGARKQDDAAEDPLTACLQGLAPDTKLYWTNKLQLGGGGLFGARAGGAPGPSAVDPGLCDACRAKAGAWTAAYASVLADANRSEIAGARAAAACRACHSGGALLGPVLCMNGECPVLYHREGAPRAEAAAYRRLGRLEASASAGCAPFTW
ncbi:hypothetical protein MNEG_1145 [Monoraphidium neglectum]|uniref:DNA polymerase delta catalytic subunit n=1 Tax=Monoraphidium neglectum TaxID=145388 RepID=A0A0D2LK96_9CHLO|nr:hypothetical protein MNEG_1145 [Monoraphidium neglectum]KIZ06809.1 hypothetical protein MNEG_1145 [Monoraphidium neglectum]|eukprot:XP_013905828.1 hypothetical protein MNEG_1145 [Monoraphidium neglectum]